MLHTWLDLSYVVGMVNKNMKKAYVIRYKAIKQILKYLRGTTHYELSYVKRQYEVNIFAYSDNDLVDDLDERRSTSGMTFYFDVRFCLSILQIRFTVIA